MSTDFRTQLASLEGETLGDLEAELLLRDWSTTRTRTELRDACFAVLTSRTVPPRMSATIAAVNLMSQNEEDTSRLWQRMMEIAPALEKAQTTNWIYGHYYRRYDRATFDRFVKLGDLVSPEDKMGIAIMLSTWSSYGADQKDVVQFIESVSSR